MNTGKNSKEAGKEMKASLLSSEKQGPFLTVKQPDKMKNLLIVLDDLEKFSERIGEDRSHDLGSGGGSAAGDDDDTTQGASMRKKAIQSLPSTPIMRRRLTRHLQREVRQLERKARQASHALTKGSAYALNELYARIRKIQALITELADAATEVVKRLYIRLFIDHQQLV